jgi:hypothetical protein
MNEEIEDLKNEIRCLKKQIIRMCDLYNKNIEALIHPPYMINKAKYEELIGKGLEPKDRQIPLKDDDRKAPDTIDIEGLLYELDDKDKEIEDLKREIRILQLKIHGLKFELDEFDSLDS